MSQLKYSLFGKEARALFEKEFPALALRVFHLCNVIDGWFSFEGTDDDENGAVSPHVAAVTFEREEVSRFEERMQYYYDHGALWQKDALPRPDFSVTLHVDLFGGEECVLISLADCNRETLAALREKLFGLYRVYYRRRFSRGRG